MEVEFGRTAMNRFIYTIKCRPEEVGTKEFDETLSKLDDQVEKKVKYALEVREKLGLKKNKGRPKKK